MKVAPGHGICARGTCEHLSSSGNDCFGEGAVVKEIQLRFLPVPKISRLNTGLNPSPFSIPSFLTSRKINTI